jgi:CTP synthase (UTP-ammonia lyase)
VRATIAALGDRDPAYLTHREIDDAIRLAPAGIEPHWVATDSQEARRIDSFDALWVLPGTPYRDDDVVYAAIRFAREQGLPVLGTCGGFQYMAVEFARNAAGIRGATHAETDPDGEAIVGALSCSLVGEERTVTAAFYMATLFQPQVGSSERDELHPLLAALARAAAERRAGASGASAARV